MTQKMVARSERFNHFINNPVLTKRTIVIIFLVATIIAGWIVVQYKQLKPSPTFSSKLIRRENNSCSPLTLFSPRFYNKLQTKIFPSIRNLMNEKAFNLLQSGAAFLSDPPAIQLSQNYDNILGETLENRIHREQSDSSFNNTIFSLNSSMLKHISIDDNHRVPSLLHYILFYETGKLHFHHLICILSGFWMIQPKYMILWYSKELSGFHWEYLKKNLSSEAHRVLLFPLRPAFHIYNERVKLVWHQADVIRLELLHEFGGIYLDQDVVVTKSFAPLYKYPLTIGRETDDGLCNGAMMSERNSEFIHIWHLFYHFYEADWNLLSVRMPHALSVYYKYLSQHVNKVDIDIDTCIIHVEEDTINRPNWSRNEVVWIYGEKRVWNWREKNYAVHLWFGKSKNRHLNFTSVKTENSMFGDLMRFVLGY